RWRWSSTTSSALTSPRATSPASSSALSVQRSASTVPPSVPVKRGDRGLLFHFESHGAFDRHTPGADQDDRCRILPGYNAWGNIARVKFLIPLEIRGKTLADRGGPSTQPDRPAPRIGRLGGVGR